MTWITWRQYRLQGAIAGGAAGVGGGWFVVEGVARAVVVATSAIPLLPGLLWGAPMVAHELETGTNQFAWTQSITRRRWLVAKTGWMLLAAGVIAGIASALVTWWSGPDHALNADAFMANRFD